MKQDIDRAENVVISGSLVDWGDELIPMFTLAIRLNTKTDVRIKRLKKREREHFGSTYSTNLNLYQTKKGTIKNR